jgi:hypothetical protein
MLEYLKEINKRQIHAVTSEEFKTYGKVIDSYDYSELIQYMNNQSELPSEGNCYYPSIEDMEQTETAKLIQERLYGEMPIQIGYCNGRNSTMNGLEYHKSSEVNIAVTDFVLILGHTWDMDERGYDSDQAECFYVKTGEAIELYQTTLHFSPCKVSENGFKDIVILPKGTNTPLKHQGLSGQGEERLLYMNNKWIIAHPERKVLVEKGVYPGIRGENIEIRYR